MTFLATSATDLANAEREAHWTGSWYSSPIGVGILFENSYYETVERTMGGRVTQDFFCLFAIPGGDHCVGGRGAATVDWLSLLEKWVEEGEAPERVLGYRIKPSHQEGIRFPPDPAIVEFSPPLYPYRRRRA